MPMAHGSVPRATLFFMGGSSTFSSRFPEDLAAPDVQVLERELVFQTPYGDSPVMKLLVVGGQPVLTTRMHGWRPGVARADASRQVFWVMREAGVRQVLAEGGVGAVNHLLDLKDLVIPTDYMDRSLRADVDLGSGHLLVMRDPFCPVLSRHLAAAATAALDADGDQRRLFTRGIYANTDGRHFESRAEVRALAQTGADLVGQSICPEVYLAREIGACFAGLYMVVNYAEGVVADWQHRDLQDIFFGEARTIGNILLDALRRTLAASNDGPGALAPNGCQCADLRKPTLLVDRDYAKDAEESPS